MSQYYSQFSKLENVDPVRVPLNEWQKIRDQGLQAIRWKQDIYDFESKQAKEFAKVKSDNAKSLINDIQNNAELQSDVGELLHKATLQNLQVSINDANRKSKKGNQTLNTLQSIADFSTNAASAYQKVQAAREKNINAFLDTAKINHGVTGRTFDLIRNADDALWSSESKRQKFLAELGFEEEDYDVVNRIRQGGNFMAHVMNKRQAVIRANSLGRFISLNGDKPIQVAGWENGLTLNTALQTPGAPVQHVLDQLTREHFSDKDGNPYFDSKVLAGSNAGNVVRDTHAGIIRTAENVNKTNSKQAEKDYLIETLNDRTGIYLDNNQQPVIRGLPGVFEVIENLSGPRSNPDYKKRRKLALQRTGKLIEEGLKSGKINPGNFEGYKEWRVGPGTDIEVSGLTGKSVYLEKHFPELYDSIRQGYIGAVESEQAKLDEPDPEREFAGIKFHNDVNKYIASGEFDAKFIKNWITHGLTQDDGFGKKYFAEGVKKLQAHAARHKHGNNDTAGSDIIKFKAAKGYQISISELESQNLSPGAHQKAMELIELNNRIVPYTKEDPKAIGGSGTFEIIQANSSPAMHILLGLQKGDSKSVTFKAGQTLYFEEVASNYRSFLLNQKVDLAQATPIEQHNLHQDAMKHAIGVVQEEIEKEEGVWKTINIKGVKEIAHLIASPGEEEIELNPSELSNNLRSDPTIISTTQMIAGDTVRRISTSLNKGDRIQIPMQAQYISLHSNGAISPIDIVAGQLEYQRKKEIETKGFSNIKPIPEEIKKIYNDVDGCLGPRGGALAASYNIVDVNKACTDNDKPQRTGPHSETANEYNKFVIPNVGYTWPMMDRKNIIEQEIMNKGESTPLYDFMLERLNAGINNKENVFITPYGWRDPFLCSRETCELLWNLGFYEDIENDQTVPERRTPTPIEVQ